MSTNASQPIDAATIRRLIAELDAPVPDLGHDNWGGPQYALVLRAEVLSVARYALELSDKVADCVNALAIANKHIESQAAELERLRGELDEAKQLVKVMCDTESELRSEVELQRSGWESCSKTLHATRGYLKEQP